ERNTVRFAVGRGVDDYLVKPFTVNDFNRRLEAFRESRTEAAAQAGPTLAQGDIDSMLRAGEPEKRDVGRAVPATAAIAAALPKGFSQPTVQLVGRALREAAGPD